MKITAISVQARDKNRVNVSVDGRYRFSLDILQVAELGIRTNKEYTDEEIAEFERASQFGKVYGRALEYVLNRPRSRKEVRDYLFRKTRDTRTKEGAVRPGIPLDMVDQVMQRLDEKRHIDDERFTRYWVENRRLRKGVSMRQLQAELMKKGVDKSIVETVMGESERQDSEEIDKMMEKRYRRYDERPKLIAYFARQGFSYDDITAAIARYEETLGQED